MNFRRLEESLTISENQNCMRMYRCIQLLEKSFNGFLMVRTIPAMVAFIPTLQIVSQYVCITMHDEIEMPGFLVFPLMLIDSVMVNIMVFTLASWVNNISTKFLHKLDKKIAGLRGTRKSNLRKEQVACCVLKIKFGSNFIDSGTPLVIQNFCLTQTMSLILIRYRNGRIGLE